MNSKQIFSLALGIGTPWEILSVKLEETEVGKELHITINFTRGTKFPDSTGAPCTIHDTQEKTWRHLNFFEHDCYIHCRVPRIKTSDNKVRLVEVPWARTGSGFTLLFESYVMALIEGEMSVNKIGQLVHEDAHRLWTIFNYWIELAYSADKPTKLNKLGIDETSSRKGHTYVTLAVDLDKRKVIHVAEGKDKAAVQAVKNHLESKGLDSKQVKQASIDMSPSFISGISEYFPEAEIHFDRFHVVKLLNEAMDKVRQLERKEHSALKGHKYTFLKNKENLSDKRRQELSELITLFPTLGQAYRLQGWRYLMKDLGHPWPKSNR